MICGACGLSVIIILKFEIILNFEIYFEFWFLKDHSGRCGGQARRSEEGRPADRRQRSGED